MMRYRCRLFAGWAAGIGLALAVAGCGGGGGGGSLAPAPATVSGTVVDTASGRPISGARVSSAGHSSRTASDGTFTVGADVGMISLTVTATNYFTGSFTATTTAGQTTDLGTVSLSNQNGSPPPTPF
jgi:Carboxypeptidase regulatory-like domain